MATKRSLYAADGSFADENDLLVRIGEHTVKRAKIDAVSAAAAGNVLVAAVATKQICVLGICLVAASAVDVSFYSDAADVGTALSGVMSLAAGGGFVIDPPADTRHHWMETVAGKALTMLLGGAVQVSGWLIYYEA